MRSEQRTWVGRLPVSVLLVVSLVFGPGDGGRVAAQVETFQPPQWELGERNDGGFYTVVTTEGEPVTETAVIVDVGDEYIDEENRLFEVVAVEGDRVVVEARGPAQMPDVSDELAALERAAASRTTAIGGLARWLAARAGGGKRQVIGIYHTHNAESYVPTSGTDSKEYGDIHKVGQALKEAFEKMGHKVIWKDDSHLPHDGQAYLRSRRTAAEISREAPATILDVHRDAIPRSEEYLANVDGTKMSQIRLVVGRQNQNREANLEYAKRIKAIADKRYPGLVKGIFHARGNYNQDLGPRMILLEFGTHVTSLEDALRSVEPTAEVIAAAAGLVPGTGDGQVGARGLGTAGWLILLVIGGGVAWLFLNKEGWEGLKRSFSSLRQKAGSRLGDDDGDGGN